MEKRTNNLIFTEYKSHSKRYSGKNNFNNCSRINSDVKITNEQG